MVEKGWVGGGGRGRKRDGLVEMGWGRTRDGSVEEERSAQTTLTGGGLAGTTTESWIDGCFWASPTVLLSFLWLGHGMSDESVSEERIFVRSGNALKVISKCKTFYTLRGGILRSTECIFSLTVTS